MVQLKSENIILVQIKIEGDKHDNAHKVTNSRPSEFHLQLTLNIGPFSLLSKIFISLFNRDELTGTTVLTSPIFSASEAV